MIHICQRCAHRPFEPMAVHPIPDWQKRPCFYCRRVTACWLRTMEEYEPGGALSHLAIKLGGDQGEEGDQP